MNLYWGDDREATTGTGRSCSRKRPCGLPVSTMATTGRSCPASRQRRENTASAGATITGLHPCRRRRGTAACSSRGAHSPGGLVLDRHPARQTQRLRGDQDPAGLEALLLGNAQSGYRHLGRPARWRGCFRTRRFGASDKPVVNLALDGNFSAGSYEGSGGGFAQRWTAFRIAAGAALVRRLVRSASR